MRRSGAEGRSPEAIAKRYASTRARASIIGVYQPFLLSKQEILDFRVNPHRVAIGRARAARIGVVFTLGRNNLIYCRIYIAAAVHEERR